MSVGSGLGFMGAGMGLSGFGNIKSNIENKATKQTLKNRASWLDVEGRPLWTQLVKGYAPGGEYRSALAADTMDRVNRTSAGEENAIKGNAWRYGGPAGGLGARMLADSQTKAALANAEARGSAGLKADEIAASLYRQDTFDTWERNPMEVKSNAWAPYGNLLFQMGQGQMSSGGGGSFKG